MIHHLTGLATGWTLALIVAAALLASGAFLRFGRRQRKAALSIQPRPVLAFGSTAVITRTIWTEVRQPGGGTVAGSISGAVAATANAQTTMETTGQRSEHADYVYVNIVNRATEKWADVTAYDAVARLEFFDTDGNQLIKPVTARWADSPNPALQHTFSSPAEHDVWHVGTDKPEPVDVVYKFRDEASCYVYTNANARAGLRDEATRIRTSEFVVRITVTSKNAENLVGRFSIKHKGLGFGPVITLLDGEA